MTELINAYARMQYAIGSKNPIFADFAVRSLMSGDEFANIRKYILDNKDFFFKNESFPNDNIALRRIIEEKLSPLPVIRGRFFEDSLKTAAKTGAVQYVILGAGLDTFAIREVDLMKEITVFEVDFAENTEDKKARLKKSGMTLSPNLKFVSHNIKETGLVQALENAGFNKNAKTFFALTGVCPLTESEFASLLGQIADFSPSGNSIALVFSENGRNLPQIRDCEPAMDFNDTEILLERAGFNIYETFSAGEKYEIPCNIFCILATTDIKESKPKENHEIPAVKAVVKKPPAVKLAKPKKNAEPQKPTADGEKLKRILSGGTKEIIFKTALRLFSRKGYEAVSVRDIAGEIGITQAALYKHYRNKRDIFDSIINYMEENAPTKSQSTAESLGAWFTYWTENEYASQLRRLLTVEQYVSSEMTELYGKYFTSGAVEYVESLCGDRDKAIKIYSAIYLHLSLWDLAEDKDEIKKKLEKIIDSGM